MIRESVHQRVPGAEHVETWVVDNDGAYMMYFRCHRCGDVSQRRCENPQARWGRWMGVYAGMHPAAPHSG